MVFNVLFINLFIYLFIYLFIHSLEIYYVSAFDSIHGYEKKRMMNGKGLKGTSCEKFEGILSAFRKEKKEKRKQEEFQALHVQM